MKWEDVYDAYMNPDMVQSDHIKSLVQAGNVLVPLGNVVWRAFEDDKGKIGLRFERFMTP